VNWEIILDIASAVCFVVGSFLSLAAGVGVLRFPDLLSRMHAGTKPQVLGVLLGLAGYGLRIRSGPVIWTVVLVALFQLLTAPVSAHMVGRAGYRTGKIVRDLLLIDELTIDLLEAKRASTASPETDDSR
jgi:multicomponent Na+:H+ antiporter subunit G